jgi:uncharacterized protein DUF3667
MADESVKLILGDTAISAVESSPGRRFFGRRKDRQRPPLSHCENCGAQLTGRYCAQCGQAAVDYRRSFRHVIVDVLDSFLNWDSKFFATIVLLIVKPWRLTNEFLAGKRVRYVHPLRLYLLASILFFFVVNYWAKAIPQAKLSDQDRAEIKAELKNEDLPPEARAKIEQALKLDSPAPSSATPAATEPRGSPPQASANTDQSLDKKSEPAFFQSGKPQSPMEKWFEQRAKEKFGEHGANFKAFIITLINNLPGMMLCCVPLFAFVLKVLYIRRKTFYIDHLIYALHIHTFAYVAIMLIVGATIGLNRVAPNMMGWIAVAWVVFAAQILISIRRVYRQGWFISIFKFLFGGLAYLIVLAVGLGVTFFVTLIMP